MQGQKLEVQLIDTCMTGINSLHQDCHQITRDTCTKDTYSPESLWSTVPFFQVLVQLKYFIFLFFMIGHLHYMQLNSYSFFFEYHMTSITQQTLSSIHTVCLLCAYGILLHVLYMSTTCLGTKLIPLVDFVVWITVELIIS